MHFNAMRTMGEFVKEYLDPNKKLRILEVGSFCSSPPHKDLMFRRYFRDNPNWELIGLDLVAGPNVDIVSEFPYNYPFEDNSFDVVISGNTMEHVENIYSWIRELTRLSNDLICIIVPAYRVEHKKPIDCWRVYPDGMRFILSEIANLEVLKCKLTGQGLDTIGVGRKKHEELS